MKTPARRIGSRPQRRARWTVAALVLTLLAGTVGASSIGGCRKPPAPAEPGPPGGAGGGPAPEVGRLAPEFELPSVWGGGKSLAGFRGKAVLLNFWSTSCPYCIREMPDLQRVNEEAPPGRAVVTINVGDSKEEVTRFLKERNLTFETLMDASGSVSKLYRVKGIPSFFAIDEEGVIRAKREGAIPAAEMKKLLDGAAGGR